MSPLDATPKPNGTKPEAAIIGAGFGGIALAVRLQAAGFQVTLYDNRDKPGGRAYVYEQEGFTFDAGPTVITDPDCLHQLFEVAGRKTSDYVELVPVTPGYRLCWEDGTRFDYVSDQAELMRQIEQINPDDIEGYKRFHEYTKEVYQEGYVKLGTVPFLNFKDMMAAAPQLVKLQSYRSVYARLGDFIKDEKLRRAFSFHTLLVGGNPFESSSIYHLVHALQLEGGIWFAKGGTGALVKALIKLFEDIGGTLKLSTEIKEIQSAGDRVTGVVTDGVVHNVDLVASNADVVHTYSKLLGGHARGQSYGASLARKRHSMSLFVTYFGLKSPPPNIAHHSVLFGQRYRELISDIFHGDELADDFSLYLHAPSVTDPSLAPEGCASYYVLSPVPHLGRADIDWEEEGPKYRDKILAYLEKHYIPNLSRDLVTTHHITPHTFRDVMNSHNGSAFSIEPILTQSAWFRPHNRDDKISNMYIVGAGTHPGAGIPGVVGSAKATAGLCVEDFAPMLAAQAAE
ncbi:MAG: phytoene desaturase [Aquisalinus sp.]|nr:phytoene desaturase [Aquisalinus sp.]